MGEEEETPGLTKAWKAERRAFWSTSGGLAALSLVWSGHKIFGYMVTKELNDLLSMGGVLEANRYYHRVGPWLHTSRSFVYVVAAVFLGSLVWWLLAIRRRRVLYAADIATWDCQGSDSRLDRAGKGDRPS